MTEPAAPQTPHGHRGRAVPAGRYGPAPDPRARRRGVVALWALGLVGTAFVAWIGLRMGSAPVTWSDVGFRVDGDALVEVVYDVSRPDPAVPVRCTLEALNEQYGQVGVVTVEVPPGTDRTVRRSDPVGTSELAVTGIVKECAVSEAP